MTRRSLGYGANANSRGQGATDTPDQMGISSSQPNLPREPSSGAGRQRYFRGLRGQERSCLSDNDRSEKRSGQFALAGRRHLRRRAHRQPGPCALVDPGRTRLVRLVPRACARVSAHAVLSLTLLVGLGIVVGFIAAGARSTKRWPSMTASAGSTSPGHRYPRLCRRTSTPTPSPPATPSIAPCRRGRLPAAPPAADHLGARAHRRTRDRMGVDHRSEPGVPRPPAHRRHGRRPPCRPTTLLIQPSTGGSRVMVEEGAVGQQVGRKPGRRPELDWLGQ